MSTQPHRLFALHLGVILCGIVLANSEPAAYGFPWPRKCTQYPCLKFADYVPGATSVDCYHHYDWNGDMTKKIVARQAVPSPYSYSNINNDPGTFVGLDQTIMRDYYDSWDVNCDDATYPKWASCLGTITKSKAIQRNDCVAP